MKKTLLVGLLGTLPLFTLACAKVVQSRRKSKPKDTAVAEGGEK